MIKQTKSDHAWTCARCNNPLLIHERAQAGLPSYCTTCLRENQIRPPSKTEEAAA